MRPVRLRVGAFGPFPGTEEIDFAALAPLGLFVITGPTGSGKTTLFDAMAYALYGVLAGQRDPNEMHSHHAPAASTPIVELDFDVAGRRYRVERSPAHKRTKKRGAGTVEVAPRAVLLRWDADTWVPACEPKPRVVTDVCTDLVGLTANQFHRVVLLPQGQFEAFLVAKGDDRRPLLRQLFGTSVYERAVEHLRRDATEAGIRADRAKEHATWARERAVEQLRTAEAAAGLADADGDEADRLTRVDTSLRQLRGALDEAQQRADRAAAEAVAADELARRWRARAGRRQRLHEMERQRPQRERERAGLEAARRAEPVVHLADVAAAAARRVAQAEAVSASHRRVLDDALRAIGRDGESDPRRLRELLADDAAQADALVARRRRVDALSAQLDEARRSESRIGVDLTTAEAELAVVAAQLTGHRAEIEALDPLADRCADLQHAAELAAAQLSQRQELAAVTERLQAAEAAVRSTDEQYCSATATFLSTAAPRLAQLLVDGEPCVVCGSREHPAPAQPALDFALVSAEQLDAMRDAASEARAQRDQLLVRLHTLASTLGELAEQPLEACVAGLAEAREAAQRAVDADARRTALAARAVELEAVAGALERTLITLHTDIAVAAERCRLAEKDHEEALAELGNVRSPIDDPVVWARAVAAARSGLDHADDLRADEERERSAWQLAEGAASDAARRAGFESVPEACRLAMQWHELAERAATLAAWDADVAELTAQLAVDDAELPDDEPFHEQLRAEAARCAALRDQLRQRVAQVETHTAAAESATAAAATSDAAAAALIAEAELAATVAARCSGQLAPRIPLENWVLGSELDRVANAANVHLAAMTNGRYQLMRAAELLDGRTGGGLDLLVADAHTGTTRRTTSLSGGERFQASLALALGLADVVSSGTAATARILDALFVDEGFGSLDAEALDQAIDTLDGLRRHGRQIGIITHVEAMKAALPTAVEVRRLPDDGGSTIRQLIR